MSICDCNKRVDSTKSNTSWFHKEQIEQRIGCKLMVLLKNTSDAANLFWSLTDRNHIMRSNYIKSKAVTWIAYVKLQAITLLLEMG